ncbi:hypothetical protein FISHEDRAFT_66121 [Fistulina hepatica ATCC 64428]|uniref:DUF4604 domain-containing protein n=1 Tax=Fistulina hepatica ATCC 64428 TaxID=1128425 RepID=A0A0D7AAI8_9AGAR|nr:hypothetical protein FISHEDRAFT_66121 [Fistulina hepatica ATCC 64428]
MAPRELTKHQLSSRLSYEQKTPGFLRKYRNDIRGIIDIKAAIDADGYYLFDEWEDAGPGRAPIPRRPPIPERQEEGSDMDVDEWGDEKPQVVVLKEGKHLTEREAENVRRAEKGLSPLPDEDQTASTSLSTDRPFEMATLQSKPTLSFSTKAPTKSDPLASLKRKASGDPEAKKKHKSKKTKTGLLSFGDEA